LMGMKELVAIYYRRQTIGFGWRSGQQRTPHIDFNSFQRIRQPSLSTLEVELPWRLPRFAGTAFMHSRPPLLGFSNRPRYGLSGPSEGI
jgi:hypothetical protein